MGKPQTNTRAFGVIMIFTQMIFGAMHGVYIRPVQQASQAFSFTGLIMPFIMGMVTILGFGLIFSYNKKLVWSGLGFTFFITAFVLQLYPLINAFWTNTAIMGDTIRGVVTPKFADDDKTFPFYLSRDYTSSFYQNHIESAFRCAIAVAIAFSSLLGRVGALECWFVCIIGTIGYELNRQLLYRLFQDDNDLSGDPYGTMYIFAFGGFMGLAAGAILSFKEKKQEVSTARHPNYSANAFSATFALLGTALLIVGLPFLIYSRHNDTTNNVFLEYLPVHSVILSVSGSTVATIGCSLLFKGKLIVRYLVYGPVAGAIIGGASDYYTSNPVYALVVGMVGGIIQTICMIVKQKLVEGGRPVNTISFSLFGVQGFVGSAFAVCWKEIIQAYADDLPYVALTSSQNFAVYGLVSAGMGVGFGILIGLFLICLGGHERKDHFTDRTYWIAYDGISTDQIQDGTDYYEQGDQIKNQHAYL